MKRKAMTLTVVAMCQLGCAAELSAIDYNCGLDDKTKFAKVAAVVEVRPVSASYWHQGRITAMEKLTSEPSKYDGVFNNLLDTQIIKTTRSGDTWTVEYQEYPRTILDTDYKVIQVFKGDLKPGKMLSLRAECIHAPERYGRFSGRNRYTGARYRFCFDGRRKYNYDLRHAGVSVQDGVPKLEEDKSFILHLVKASPGMVRYRMTKGDHRQRELGVYRPFIHNLVSHCNVPAVNVLTGELGPQYERFRARRAELKAQEGAAGEPDGKARPNR